MPDVLDVLIAMQRNHPDADFIFPATATGGLGYGRDAITIEDLGVIDSTLAEVGVDHSSPVGATGPTVMSFEAWSTEYLTDLARENDANIEDAAVGTWIASNADALTNALRKCAVGFMLDADPIPGGDDA